MSTTTLYRPVGLFELEKIAATQWREFPPRLEWQPIFYPVLNEPYACEIAEGWNTPDEGSGYAGFVLAFDVDSEYLARFETQNVGGPIHNELWVPAEELVEFNQRIMGPIRLLRAYYGQKYTGAMWALNV